MSLQTDVLPAELLSGSQTPRVCTVPPFVSSAGAEAVDLELRTGTISISTMVLPYLMTLIID